jgi:Delta7-sterol 5-desaturase
MFETIPPLHYILTKGHFVFAFDFGRYFLAASITFAVVWIMRRSRLRTRKIQTRDATPVDMRREFLQSLQSASVYTIGSAFIFWGNQSGILQKFEGSRGMLIDLVLVTAIIIGHDAYFYWTHRAMHHPRLFKMSHLAHHRSITPTPWAAYSFAIPEAIVAFMFVPLWLFFVSTPGWVMFVWLNFQIIRNAMGHAGFEFFPRWWLATSATSWINTTVHHDLHHAGSFAHNYGLYFTWWDKWMGTEHPQYHAKFAEVVGQAHKHNLDTAVNA